MFSIIGIAILIIGLVGVTFAFFNYTKTGAPNNIRTGRIAFNSEQGDEVTLSDLFPISATGDITPETPGVGSVTVHVTGDTSYDKGVEYIVKAVNVSNSSGGSSLPISVGISYTASEGDGKTIGESDESYFINRGGRDSLYRVLTTDTIAEGEDLVVGYIAPGETGIDGNIIIMAYLDANNIAITDTYPNVTYYEVNDSLTEGELAECVSYLSSLNVDNAFCSGTGTISHNSLNITFQQALDLGVITAAQKEHLASENIIYEIYTDGTDDDWVQGRTVLTTDEWNALSSSGVSFQIRVEANQGVWVPATVDGTASITPTGANAANISLIQGDMKYETTVTISGDIATFTNGVLSKYNEGTSSYDNVTTSDKYNKVNVSFQHANCNSGNIITVTNHADANYIDGLETLDASFVQCLITNNQ
jgi:hypothetical protein